MKHQAGIWIDREHAMLIALATNALTTTRFRTREETSSASTKPSHSYTPRDFQPEGRQERKDDVDRKRMYDLILDAIAGIDALIVMGPGEAKSEFAKYIAAKKSLHFSVEVESCDHLTEPQLVAKVRQHFANL